MSSKEKKKELIQSVIKKAKDDLDFISEKNKKTALDRDDDLIDDTLKRDFDIKVRNNIDNLLKKKNDKGQTYVAIHSEILKDFFCDRSKLTAEENLDSSQPIAQSSPTDEEILKRAQQFAEERARKTRELEDKYKLQSKDKLKEEQLQRLEQLKKRKQ